MDKHFNAVALVGGLVALVLLLTAGLSFLVWPTWLKGGYCEVTVTSVQLDPDCRVAEGRIRVYSEPDTK